MPAVLAVPVSDELLAHLQRRAAEQGTTPEEVVARHLADLLPKSATDPFLKLAGLFHSGVPDAADRHDHYIGQALAEDLDGGGGP